MEREVGREWEGERMEREGVRKGERERMEREVGREWEGERRVGELVEEEGG